MSFCRGGRSRLLFTDWTSHSIPVLIPSLANKKEKVILTTGSFTWLNLYDE